MITNQIKSYNNTVVTNEFKSMIDVQSNIDDNLTDDSSRIDKISIADHCCIIGMWLLGVGILVCIVQCIIVKF